MNFNHLFCPLSPSVWDGDGFSECFDNLVIGFGANAVTIVLILVLAIALRNSPRIHPIIGAEKVVFYILPVLGACLSFVEMVSLFRKELRGHIILYHQWLSQSSQLIVWMIVIISSKSARLNIVFCRWILSFWWLIKSLLGIPHLLKTYNEMEDTSFSHVLTYLEESCFLLLDIVFGISINIIRKKRASLKNSSILDPLLSANMDVEEGFHEDSEDAQNIWDLMTFKSIACVMDSGVKKQLEFGNLLVLPSDMEPSICHDKLLGCWRRQECHPRPSLFKAICCAYGWSYCLLGILKVFNDLIGFAGPLLLNKLIQFLQQGSAGWYGYFLAFSLGIVSILKSFADTQYTFHLAKLKLKLRSSIMTIIYQKCLYVTLAERSKFSEGEIQTFMSVDADRTVNLCNSFHDMWSLPLQIGIALYLLYTQVKFAFLSGLAITVLLIPVNKWISERIASATKEMMKQKDERIRRTGEILTHIRTLKMYGWELLFSGWLMETRSSEVKHLATRKYLDAWCVFFWATTPALFSLFTFGLFVLMGHQLDAATVFTCLALFNNLISPLNSFPWVINGLIEAFISVRRLSRFLCCSEYKRESEKKVESPMLFPKDNSEYISEDIAVLMHDASCTWSSSDEEKQSMEEKRNMVLNNINLILPRGLLIAVIGEVGSGKSSLLNAVLGEMRLLHGSIHSCGSIAYVPQVPWVLSGTVRDNILFGKAYDEKRYMDSIISCALDVDISLMAGGDMAYIGEKGVNLSGGQRARLALARAIYHGSDIYMLDDVFSAVDAHVARLILNNAIGGLISKKTCILCTHNVQAISSADLVVVMEKGQVRWVGNQADLAISTFSALAYSNEYNNGPIQREEFISDTNTEGRQNELVVLEKDSTDVSLEALEIVEVELRKAGRVEFSVYKNYAAFSGWLITAAILSSAILMQASRNGNDLWLSFWVDTTGSGQTQYAISFYLVVLCIFCVVNSILTLLRAFSFAFGGLRAAVLVHNKLLNKLIDAPVQFFDQTPGGRILNRFSSDLFAIDDSLPFILNIFLANFVGLLGIAIVLSYVQVLFLLLLVPFWFIYSKLQLFYRSTSRELRRLDSVSRSPIYTTFIETLDGSSTIRAFKSQDLFQTKFTEHVALYQRTSYSEIIASLWLALRLQLLAGCIVAFVAATAVMGSLGYLPISFGTPGLVGLALSYAAPIVSFLGSFLTSFTETEKEMVSVERVLQYMDVPQEELGGSQSLNTNWPHQGLVEFKNVTMRYMPSLPPALHGITFTIVGGSQVGIVGRTGAGKSSILNSLFRLSPVSSGHIFVDGLNIADVPVRDLRAHLAIVPQSPFLFQGSLRNNLDPLQKADDQKIWHILEKCHIKEEVEAAGGLNIPVKECGSSFSVGQKQLICLARALLKCSKVLCLDECTANIDNLTASVLQNTISAECRGMTVITIAHRISTVVNMDSILVLEHGNLVEQGNPQDLLRNECSKFSSFARASTTS